MPHIRVLIEYCFEKNRIDAPCVGLSNIPIETFLYFLAWKDE